MPFGFTRWSRARIDQFAVFGYAEGFQVTLADLVSGRFRQALQDVRVSHRLKSVESLPSIEHARALFFGSIDDGYDSAPEFIRAFFCNWTFKKSSLS